MTSLTGTKGSMDYIGRHQSEKISTLAKKAKTRLNLYHRFGVQLTMIRITECELMIIDVSGQNVWMLYLIWVFSPFERVKKRFFFFFFFFCMTFIILLDSKTLLYSTRNANSRP